MTNKTQMPKYAHAQNQPMHKNKETFSALNGSIENGKDSAASAAAADAGAGAGVIHTEREHKTAPLFRSTTRRIIGTLFFGIAAWLLAFLFSHALLLYELQPLGIAFVCAAGTVLPWAAAGVLMAGLLGVFSEGVNLYLVALLITVGIRYAAGRFLYRNDAVEERSATERIGKKRWGRDRNARAESLHKTKPLSFSANVQAAAMPADGTPSYDGPQSTLDGMPPYIQGIVRLYRLLFPEKVFTQSVGMRVGISILAACPIAAGVLLTTPETVTAVSAAAFMLCAVPAFTWLFCGLFDEDGARCTPAHKEGAIGALCYAVTASIGGSMLFGFSLRLLCAHAMTLFISKKSGYLRGGLCGLLCGFACDALYAPAYALIGAVSGLFWNLYLAPAVVLSLCSGAAYAIYVGEFAAIRSVVPEMIAVSALAYPIARYLPDTLKKSGIGKKLSFLFPSSQAGAQAPPMYTNTEQADRVTPEQLGIPGLAEQLDTLSGILNGLSTTFYHLSDRQKKPGLYEIRQLCESTADRYCAHCPKHDVCWEQDFSATADAMGRITLCIHRRGRAESSAGTAFQPLEKRCPNLQKMLASMNDAAAALFEEKITSDKTEVAAGDYEGMAKLLRASAEEASKAGEKDAALSRRLGRAMGRMGFLARDVSVYGARRRTVIARGVDLGGKCTGEGARDVWNRAAFGGTLLGTEELREAFSALAGVRYRSPEYSLTAGGAELVMTMHAAPKVSVKSGCWGEKKAGEEVTGDMLTLFANRADYFYTLVCDGMGSGREASVTAQISTLFLEKLLSVSCAKGAALNLLNGYLRSRAGECSATVDLCEIDMITGDAHFVKCGAAASYLVRGDSMFRIASSTMPLGILREVSAEETAFALLDGDILLFFSDGVCGECEDASWIADALDLARENYAKEYARMKTRERCKDVILEEEGDLHTETTADKTMNPEQAEDAVSAPNTEDAGFIKNTEDVSLLSDSDMDLNAEKEPVPNKKEKGRLLSPLDYIARALGEEAKKRIGRQDDMTVAVVEIALEEVRGETLTA